MKVEIVDEAVTRKVAKLARLKLTDKECSDFSRQIEGVLVHVRQIMEINTDEVEPLMHPLETQTPFREDIVHNFQRSKDGHSRLIDCAPETLSDGYKVPSIL